MLFGWMQGTILEILHERKAPGGAGTVQDNKELPVTGRRTKPRRMCKGSAYCRSVVLVEVTIPVDTVAKGQVFARVWRQKQHILK